MSEAQMDMPPDLPERVTVLEKLFERMEQRLDRIDQRLARMEERLTEMDRRFTEQLAEIRGMLSERPTMWQLITYTLGAQVTLAGLLFAAYKLGHG